MNSILEINEYHSESLTAIIRFLRFKNLQRLKSIEGCFEDARHTSLKGSIYTINEVENIIKDLESQVTVESDLEFINATHTTILLLTQLFQQAERWHLRLAPDIGELENQNMLYKIKAFEDSFHNLNENYKVKIEPLSGDRAANLLQNEIARLQNENADLRKKISGNTLKIDKNTDQDLELENVKEELSNLKRHISQREDFEKIRELLQLSQQELDKRVHETIPFQNLKRIVIRKNEQLKELRKQLSEFQNH